MIEKYKNRELKEGNLVQIYRNLHNKMFSIRCSKTKLVLAHGTNFIVKNVKPVVNQNARKKVNREKMRIVHAYLEGEFHGEASEETFSEIIIDEIYYNPYKTESFMLRKTGDALESGNIVAHGSRIYKIK